MHDVDQSSIGVYVLANDRVIDWFLAFANSFRRWNPTLPLVVLPFDDELDQVKGLAEKYDFTIYESPRLAALTELGYTLTDRRAQAHMFRKLALFEGPFDAFFYFDSDVIVLDDISPILARIKKERCLAYYDDDMVFDWVYPDKAFAQRMIDEYESVGFNAGSFGCVRGAFDPALLPGLAEEAKQYRTSAWENGWDQVFINWVIDKTRVPKLSLSILMGEQIEAAPTSGNLRFRGSIDQASRTLCKGKWVPFVHYAGYVQGLDMPLRKLWLAYHDDWAAAMCKLARQSLSLGSLKRRAKGLLGN